MSSRPSRGAARLAAILDALPDGLVLVNCNGTVVNANTIALGMFETPGTALVGRGLLDLLPEFDSRLIPGSMRRPEGTDERGRTKPTRMIARRTDGSEFPVEVTSASLEDGREAYDSYGGYTGDELLMLVVRDLTGTLDTEAELARSQRQTEMILRAAAEGVVGTDTDGRVVLVNPAAAQILGYRAGELGGQELHPLILSKRADGEPFPYEDSPLADTLKSGRKHRVRGQVLWAKKGDRVPVDLTTAPVRDGDQLVGAVMTFTDRRPYEQLVDEHAAEITELTERNAAELADRAERNAAEREAQQERYASLTARHEQLTAVLAESLRGPLEELRAQLGTLAADDAGQLWPEANQVLHHLAAGYARMTALVDNVLGYQRLDAGAEALDKHVALLDGVVTAGIDGAVDLIGPGRAQFAVHAPPIEAEVDAARLATALSHLVADVAGVDATGKNRTTAQGSVPADSTIVVAAAQRGDVVRIEVRGPYAGGDPVHGPVVRGIVAAHGGVVQTHEVPGTSGGAYVLEVPLGTGRGTIPATRPTATAGSAESRNGGPSGALALGPAGGPAGGPADGPAGGGREALALPVQASAPVTAPPAPIAPSAPSAPFGDSTDGSGGGRRRARRGSTDAFLESSVAPEGGAEPSGRRRARTGEAAGGAADLIPAQQNSGVGQAVSASGSTPSASSASSGTSGASGVEPTGRRRGRPAEGSVVTAAEGAQGRAALGAAVPPQGVSVEPSGAASAPALARALPAVASAEAAPEVQPSGRRRRALAAAQERAAAAEAGPRTPFALPPADADRAPDEVVSPFAMPGAAPVTGPLPVSDEGQHEAVRGVPGAEHTPPQPHPHGQPQGPVPSPVPPVMPPAEPTGRRRAVAPPPPEPEPDSVPRVPHAPSSSPARPEPRNSTGSGTGTGSVPLPPELPMPKDSTQGRAFSVRTLGQGVPFVPPTAVASPPVPPVPPVAVPVAPVASPVPAAPAASGTPSNGSGRRRKLATPPEVDPPVPAALPAPSNGEARPHPQTESPSQALAQTPSQALSPAQAPSQPEASLGLVPAAPEGRAYAIGAPAEGSAEGPEPLDGPGGAVEVANRPAPRPVDDELPPEPLDNPRRLLVWPAPDVSTQQALSDRGYRPVIVHSREEVDAQIAAFPAALFVDPLTGPITRTALQSLRQAAVAAEVPVLLAAGLGQATREAAYGADPAVLLKALAPRDSEQHPSRVLLIEENEDIAEALAATLERRGMQVARAATDTEAVTLATQTQPNLVVMDLMQVRRRRAGIIDWLRANGQLNRTPLVVYTSADLAEEELPRLSSGETVLFLAERSNSAEVQARIVDLLAKIGTN
ncbi:PAS domain-containing protein [Streptomyces sp. NBC_00572]|uniref:PAS domain-containing protein n=1 Tax=Streptomyces sp. NBC_00572 TaxID=2903664 RepID=UPI002257F228|nr:PAS domain-containing protein [Streptomyces sp. NBC_00572]MCX4982210.1 PAS domain-containing protein [Streptomyces sp. NBC_00572]